MSLQNRETFFVAPTISGRYHPQLNEQGQRHICMEHYKRNFSITKTLRLGTAVPCPTWRIHVAVIAQATVIAGALMVDRYFWRQNIRKPQRTHSRLILALF
jgi:hypothetical protein